MDYRLVSADGHINELPDLWTRDVPEEFADLVPRVISTPEGGDQWVLAPSLPPRKMGSSAAVSATGPQGYRPTTTYKEMRPGSFDPAARVKDMLLDGVDAEVLYPGQGRALDLFANEDVRLFCARRYNDWIAEFQAAAPERLVGLAILPQLEDGENASNTIGELERIHRLGLRGAFLALGIDGPAVSNPSFEAFWAKAAELNIPISFHIGNSRQHWVLGRTDFGPGEKEAILAGLPLAIAEQLGQMIFSGIMNKYPDLKIVLAECGVGWIPFVLQRMDAMTHRHRFLAGSDRLPSEIFRDQFLVTFQEDVVGLRLSDILGYKALMWASDYPHSETTWPNSTSVVERDFKDMENSSRSLILRDNCAKLYGLIER